MELRHLRYFVAAAEELNISRAAARLRLSQPPLSRQIRDLEQEIGTPLFDRRYKRLKLTSAGAYFLPEARKILSHATRAARLAKAAGTGQTGQITIAFLSPLGGMFLPRIIRSFRQKFPLVDIDLREMVPRQQLEALVDHHIDLGFLPKSEIESTSDVAFEPLMEVQLRLALAPGHRLARQRRIPLKKLEQEKFVIFKRSAAPATHDFILQACRSAGFEPNIVKQSDRAQASSTWWRLERALQSCRNISNVIKPNCFSVNSFPIFPRCLCAWRGVKMTIHPCSAACTPRFASTLAFRDLRGNQGLMFATSFCKK